MAESADLSSVLARIDSTVATWLLLSVVVFPAVHALLDRFVFTPLGKHLLRLKGAECTLQEERADWKTLEKWQESCWKCIASTALTAASGIALADQSFWRDTQNFWTECSQLPCEYDTPPKMRFAYALDMAYYTYAIPYCIFFETKRKDFWATFVHHLVTVALIGYSYATGFTKVGVVIMFLHDVCDPWLEGAKLSKYGKLPDAITNCIFVVFLLVWFAMRVFYYPIWVIRSVLWECYPAVLGRPEVTQFPHWHLFSSMLITLWLLHLYWSVTIVSIAVTALTGGATEDPRESEQRKQK